MEPTVGYHPTTNPPIPHRRPSPCLYIRWLYLFIHRFVVERTFPPSLDWFLLFVVAKLARPIFDRLARLPQQNGWRLPLKAEQTRRPVILLFWFDFSRQKTHSWLLWIDWITCFVFKERKLKVLDTVQIVRVELKWMTWGYRDKISQHILCWRWNVHGSVKLKLWGWILSRGEWNKVSISRMVIFFCLDWIQQRAVLLQENSRVSDDQKNYDPSIFRIHHEEHLGRM